VRQRRKQRIGRIYTTVLFSLMALAFAWIAIHKLSTRSAAKPLFGEWYMVVPPMVGESAGIRTDLTAPLYQWKIKGRFTTAEGCEQAVKQNKSSMGGEPVYGRPYDDRNTAGRARIFAARCVRADLMRSR
jgi:hypothetical protein